MNHFETRAIHDGQDPDPLTGAVNVPIYQTSTYAQDAVGAMRGGHDYARSINPTRTALEVCLASLEEADHGIAFSSGMGAIAATMELVRPGQRVVAVDDLYGGTYRLFSKLLEPKGYRFAYVDLAGPQATGEAFAEAADMVWIETPTNPLLKVVDIEAVSDLAHRQGAIVVVDNTFASPYCQTPLSLGADVVVHSTTKYVGGHSDVVGGIAITRDPDIAQRLRFVQNSAGAVPAPLDCFLTLRGAKTLALRMERHCENAARIASWLESAEGVAEVIYPGLASHPGHAVASRQMRGFGGIVSFRFHGGEAAARAALEQPGVWTLGESLGGVESLVEHPGVMTHASLAGSGFEVPDDLIRLSVGIEHIEDLERDLGQMVARAARSAAQARSRS
jgi:cystathionine beta-lyase/cystathionine gamma-synthase